MPSAKPPVALTQKSTKYVIIGLFVVAFCNLYFFLYNADTMKEFEITLDKILSLAIKGDRMDPVYSLKTQELSLYRTYMDDRTNGLVVVARLRGETLDPDDLVTQQIKHLVDNAEKQPFNLHEIHHYFAPSVPSSSRLLSLQIPEQILDYSVFRDALIGFFETTMKSIEDAKPLIGGINNDDHYNSARLENKFSNRNGRIPVYGGHWRESYTEEPVRTKEFLSYFLRLSESEIEELKRSHQSYIEKMPNKVPEKLLRVGASFGYMKGDGIVYLGGGKYNQLVMLSISILRSTGSTIPVEVIIPKKSDFDIDLCSVILPTLNGRCKIMEDFLPSSLVDSMKGFQLKNIALLVSSFKNVLYMDADNIPVKNPDFLFANEPFLSSRMVIWPDLWRRSTSPSFYDIANIPTEENFHMRNSVFNPDKKSDANGKQPFHDMKGTVPEASSETGQILIDKEKHFATLMLSMYYNFYGPDYYYPLLSQGAAGEGDKETFIVAAHRLGLPYYQVNEFNREFGPMSNKKKHEYFAMGQYDPIIDYIESKSPNRNSDPPKQFAANQNDDEVYNYGFYYYKSHSLMFLHANWPKFYLTEMFEGNSFGRGPKDGEGKRRRLYSDAIMKDTHAEDFELHLMKHLYMWACEAKINLIDVPEVGSDKRVKICSEIQSQIDYLYG